MIAFTVFTPFTRQWSEAFLKHWRQVLASGGPRDAAKLVQQTAEIATAETGELFSVEIDEDAKGKRCKVWRNGMLVFAGREPPGRDVQAPRNPYVTPRVPRRTPSEMMRRSSES